MEHDHASSAYRDIHAPSDAFCCPGSQFPELAVDVFDVRLMQLLQPQRLDHVEKAQQSGLETRWQRFNLGIDDVERQPSIAYSLYS